MCPFSCLLEVYNKIPSVIWHHNNIILNNFISSTQPHAHECIHILFWLISFTNPMLNIGHDNFYLEKNVVHNNMYVKPSAGPA
jgi:hypothetical protein